MLGVTRTMEENNCINQTSQLKLILLMTALEINLVSPAGPAQIGWWTQFSKPTHWATVCQPPFQMQPMKRKMKDRLKLNEL